MRPVLGLSHSIAATALILAASPTPALAEAPSSTPVEIEIFDPCGRHRDEFWILDQTPGTYAVSTEGTYWEKFSPAPVDPVEPRIPGTGLPAFGPTIQLRRAEADVGTVQLIEFTDEPCQSIAPPPVSAPTSIRTPIPAFTSPTPSATAARSPAPSPASTRPPSPTSAPERAHIPKAAITPAAARATATSTPTPTSTPRQSASAAQKVPPPTATSKPVPVQTPTLTAEDLPQVAAASGYTIADPSKGVRIDSGQAPISRTVGMFALLLGALSISAGAGLLAVARSGRAQRSRDR